MYFYHVLARLGSYHGADYLTYHSEDKLLPGNVVQISVRKKQVLGVVMEEVSKPPFATKPIDSVVFPEVLPATIMGLIDWLIAYYPAPLGTIAQQFLPGSLAQTSQKPPAEPAAAQVKRAPKLTKEQASVLKDIRSSTRTTFLLHGDTGTGKTRVYVELAKEALEQGRSALILTPEIGLTPQLITDFEDSFGGRDIVLFHSTLTPRERREAWLRILRATQPVIVIGPRSTLFTPIKDIGLVVVDEFHESAYKQEQAPYYQAVRVAAQVARLHNARLVYGSATPPVQEYYIAEAKGTPILRMQQIAAHEAAPERSVEIVDLKKKDNLTRNPHLSNKLLDAIKETLLRKEQVLIFLNRRGTARVVLCQKCGWHALCPNCDIPLTYHGDFHSFQCHTCGFRTPARTSCPECGSPDIIFKSIGTKSIVDALQREFRGARIQRFDTDTKKADRLEHHYEDIVSGDIDILVGTQMVGKGLDLPKLALVGVAVADTSLYFPDFTSEEHTYQLLYQVLGRVGRGHREGQAIIQTYTPNNHTLQAAVSKDWQSFYETQLEQRKQFVFPPFCYLLKLTCARARDDTARNAALRFKNELNQHGLKISVIGPSPGFHEKVAGKYRWQLIIKSKDRGELLKILPLLPPNWTYDLDPSNLL